MNAELSLLLTLAAGGLGSWLGYKSGITSGVLLGAVIAAGALHIAVDDLSPLGPNFRVGAQIAIGTVLGATLTRAPFLAIKSVLWPVAIAVGALLATSAGIAVLAHSTTDLSLITSLFAFAPGGGSEMASAALNLDANVPLIAAIHVLRQIFVFVVVGSLMGRYLRNWDAKRHET